MRSQCYGKLRCCCQQPLKFTSIASGRTRFRVLIVYTTTVAAVVAAALFSSAVGKPIIGMMQQQRQQLPTWSFRMFATAFPRQSSVIRQHWRRRGRRRQIPSLRFVQELSTSSSATTPSTSAAAAPTRPCGFTQLFDLKLAHGRCVGVRIDDNLWCESNGHHYHHNDDDETINATAATTATSLFASWVHKALHPDEVAYASKLASPASQKSFVGGRLALRHAMNCNDQDDDDDSCRNAILKDAFGRPTLPLGVVGSISHKGNVAVALVANKQQPQQDELSHDGQDWAIGVDLEVRQKGRQGIARRILTPNERDSLGLLLLNDNVDGDEEVLLRFSLKEAIYKAMHPLICQYVTFQEAEIRPLPDGKVDAQLNLKSGDQALFESVSADWQVLECDDNNDGDKAAYFLTSAKVRLRPGVDSRSDKDKPEECIM